MRRAIMRITIGYLVFLGLSFQHGVAQSSPSPAVTSCAQSDSGNCRISWRFQSKSWSQYWVQQFNVTADRWVESDGPYAESSGASTSDVPGGFLYRVVGCNDPDDRRDCEVSTVFWAPVRVESEALIPAQMKGPNGETFSINKSGNLTTQLLQYNVYLITQMVGAIGDLSRFPAMSDPPPRDKPGSWTFAEMVHANVYPNYEIPREAHLAAKKVVDRSR